MSSQVQSTMSTISTPKISTVRMSTLKMSTFQNFNSQNVNNQFPKCPTEKYQMTLTDFSKVK